MKKKSQKRLPTNQVMLFAMVITLIATTLGIAVAFKTAVTTDSRSQAAGKLLLFGKSCDTSPISDLAITTEDANVVLKWSVSNRAQYIVYRSATPYFTQNQATVIGRSSNGTFVDRNSTINNPAVHSFYAVVRDCGKRAAQLSNQVGEWEWDFSAVPIGYLADFAMPFVAENPHIDAVIGNQMVGSNSEHGSDLIHYIHGNSPETLETAWYCDSPQCEAIGSGYFHKWISRTQGFSQIELVANDAYRIRMHNGETPPTQQLLLIGALPKPDPHFFENLTTDFLGVAHTMIPLDRTDLRMASDVLRATPRATMVSKYTVKPAGWQVYMPAQPESDFAVYPGMPIWINLEQASSPSQLRQQLQ